MKENENEIIPIGDIRYNDKMNILLETEIKITEKFLEKSQIDYMIIELWITDINDHTSKLIDTQSVLFSLSKNEDELKDLNKLVEYLVQLQNIQKREKEVAQLLKDRRTDEALLLQSDTSQRFTKVLEESKLASINLEDDERMAYVIQQAETMSRRSKGMEGYFDTAGITDEELLLHSHYHSKLNQKI